MRIVCVIIIHCFLFAANAQDTLFQNFENIEISANPIKEIVYNDSKQYILDFYIGDAGRLLLLRKRSHYFVYTLNSKMNVESKLKLTFKPEQLYHDCLGFLHVLARDSMYQLDITNGNIRIVEANPISLYDNFFEKCVAGNQSHLIFRHDQDFNQTTIFFEVDTATHVNSLFYVMEDSLLIRSAQDTHDTLMRDDPGEHAIMGEVKGYDLDATKRIDFLRDQKQHQDFFYRIVAKERYIPIFAKKDTIVIIDYLNRKVMVIQNGTHRQGSYPIGYAGIREVLFDEKRAEFYVVSIERGAQVYGKLSKEDFSPVKRTRIHDHPHAKKAIVYDGFLYYLAKEYSDDNLNKLFRYRL